MVTLYECVNEYREALAWMEDHADELGLLATGEIHPELDEMLNRVEGQLEVKVENVALVIQDRLGSVKKLKEEAARLTARARSEEKAAGHLKEWLAANLRAAGIKKVEGDLVKVGLRKNSAPSIRPADPDFIPEAFRKIVVTFDATAAKEHLKAADKMPTDVGRYEIDDLIVERGEHLRIW